MGDVRALPWITDPSKTLDRQPDLALIAELEGLVRMAKIGDLRGIAYATAHQDGAYGWGWHSANLHGMIGCVSLLDHRLKEREVEKRLDMDMPEPC